MKCLPISRSLALTSDQRLWRKNKPILFLGEWCLKFSEKPKWEKLDFIIARPYGVDFDSKNKDNELVTTLIEDIFDELVDKLNLYHNESNTKRYWRILLGEWLIKYTALIVNRVGTINQALDEYDIEEISVLDHPSYNLAVKDTLSFTLASSNVLWNSVLYSRILELIDSNKSIKKVSVTKNEETKFSLRVDKLLQGKHSSSSLSNRIYLEKIISRLNFPGTGLIINSYLNKPFLIKFMMYMGIIPWKYKSIDVDDIEVNKKIREDFHEEVHGNEIKILHKKLLFELLPTCFLEGYQNLKSNVDILPWPPSPKFIFTSNNYCYDETFQIWTAINVSHGSKYYIGQHAANFGTLKFVHSEKECLKVADKLITWGWIGEDKCYPAFLFQTVEKKIKKNKKNGSILLVQIRIRPSIDTWDNYYEYSVYMRCQFRFVSSLKNDLKKNMTVRLHSGSSYDSWGTREIWEDMFPEIHYDDGSLKFESLIKNSSIVVFTSLSTGFSYMLNLNLPAIIFWNTDIEILRNDAQDVFDELVEAKVVFTDPIKAADHVNMVSYDVHSWWENEKVQNAIKKYCTRFAKSVDSPYKTLKSILESI